MDETQSVGQAAENSDADAAELNEGGSEVETEESGSATTESYGTHDDAAAEDADPSGDLPF